MNWTVEYYRDLKDKEPVKEFIDGLSENIDEKEICKRYNLRGT